MGAPKVDILGLLPEEVGLQILSYMSPRELVTCSEVSRDWRSLANDNLLWKKFSPENERKLVAQKDPSRAHRTMFNRQLGTVNNWKKGKHCIWELESSEEPVTVANGGLLLTTSQTSLDVYDFNDGTANLRQSLAPPKPWTQTHPVLVSADGCTFTVETCFNHLFSFYRWNGEMFVHSGCVVAEGVPPRLVPWNWKDQPRSRARVLNPHYITPWYTVVFTTSDQEPFPDRELEVFFWSVEEGKTLGNMSLEGPLHAVDSTPTQEIVLYSGASLVLCSRLGTILNTIPTFPPVPVISVRAFSNPTTQLGVMLTPRGRYYSAWTPDWLSLGTLFTLDTAPDEGAILHPTLPVVCYVGSRNLFNAEDIESHTLLWVVPAICEMSAVLKCKILTERYLCYVCTTPWRRGGVRTRGLVLDLEDRSGVQFTIPTTLPTRGTVLSNKCIITRNEDSTSYKIISFT